MRRLSACDVLYGRFGPPGSTVVSPYGMRWGRLRADIDIAAPAGTPVVASGHRFRLAERLRPARGCSGLGGIATAYGHILGVAVPVGQFVGQGRRVASVGCTGHC